MSILKIKELQGLLEEHELRIVDMKGVQDSIQALQAQTFKKNEGNGNFTGRSSKGTFI